MNNGYHQLYNNKFLSFKFEIFSRVFLFQQKRLGDYILKCNSSFHLEYHKILISKFLFLFISEIQCSTLSRFKLYLVPHMENEFRQNRQIVVHTIPAEVWAQYSHSLPSTRNPLLASLATRTSRSIGTIMYTQLIRYFLIINCLITFENITCGY